MSTTHTAHQQTEGEGETQIRSDRGRHRVAQTAWTGRLHAAVDDEDEENGEGGDDAVRPSVDALPGSENERTRSARQRRCSEEA